MNHGKEAAMKSWGMDLGLPSFPTLWEEMK
jgi:hypothetical protein